MTKILVDAEALKRVLNYMLDEEADDYQECVESDWTDEQLQKHIYISLVRLENDFLASTPSVFDHNPLDSFPTIWSKT
jgi:hypothetical protein